MALFKEKKPVEKPNKVKIDIKFDKARDSINERLERYNSEIDAMRSQVIQFKQQHNDLEAKRVMDRIKRTTIYRHKTLELMDKLEDFRFMIDEAFSKMELYQTVGEVMGEVNKVNMAPEVKDMMKDLSNFEKEFSTQFNKLDQGFGFITESINNVDTSTKTQIDDQLQKQVDEEMRQMEEDTDTMAQGADVSTW